MSVGTYRLVAVMSWEPDKPTPPWMMPMLNIFVVWFEHSRDTQMMRTWKGTSGNVVDKILLNRYGFALHRGSFVLEKCLLLDTA